MDLETPDNLYCEEAERAVISSVLLEPDVIHDVVSRLDPTYFYVQSHRLIWAAMQQVADRGGSPDFHEVLAELDAEDVLDRVGEGGRDGSQYLASLMEHRCTAALVNNHADTVVQRYRLRKIRDQCRETAYEITQGATNVESAQSQLDQMLVDSTDEGGTGEQLEDVHEEFVEHVGAVKQGDVEPSLSTGINPVDDALHAGLNTGRYYLLAARPKHGKTKLAVAITTELIRRHGFTVDWWYTDGPKQDIAKEYTARLAEIDSQKLHESPGELSVKEVDQLKRAGRRYQDWDVEVHAQGAPQIQDVAIRARARAANADKYCLVVDYIQRCEAGYDGDSRDRQNVAETSRRLAELRTDLDDVIILGLAQFNRAAEHGEDIPQAHQLRNSGQLEQDVNHLLVWHRPSMKEQTDDGVSKRRGLLHHQLSKHTETQCVVVDADLSTNRFRRWDSSKVNQQAPDYVDRDRYNSGR